MTGVQAGSGGTGVLEGSRPGTGVTGGSGPTPPGGQVIDDGGFLEMPLGNTIATFTDQSAANAAPTVTDSKAVSFPAPLALTAQDNVPAPTIPSVTDTPTGPSMLTPLLINGAEDVPALTPEPVAFVAAAATGGSFTDAPLTGQQAGDLLVWYAGRSNGSNDTVLTGSVQGVIAPLERHVYAVVSGAVYATIWDGVETFSFAHSVTAGAQAMMNKVVLRNAVSVSVVDRGDFGVDAGWTLAGTASTFPDFLVGADELGIMMFVSSEPSITPPYTWTNATSNGINPGTTNSGNGATVWNYSKTSGDSGADSVCDIGGMAATYRFGFNLLAVPATSPLPTITDTPLVETLLP